MEELLRPRARDRLGQLEGRRVGIVGLGREGTDLVRFLADRGARVVVSDPAPSSQLAGALATLRGLEVEYRLGAQSGSDLLHCSEIFVSPGVSRSAPVVTEAIRAGIPLSSATRLFFELCPGKILGVTGSSGKTTTTSLIGAILKGCSAPVLVGGNMGIPLLGRLPEVTRDTWCVLELSSFQLEDMDQPPQVAVVLNITPNHLDRHADMAEYTQAKGNLVRFQAVEDLAVLNADDATVAALPHASRDLWFSLWRPVPGAWLDGPRLMLSTDYRPPSAKPEVGRAASAQTNRPLLQRGELKLRGLHNVANVLAAAATTAAVGCSRDGIARAIRAFEPVPHRLEHVASIDGVTFINDSIATSPERSIAGLRSFDAPVVLIAGGRDKHLPMEDWATVVLERARAVVLVGEAAPKIRAALEHAKAGLPIVAARRFADVVPLARELAHPGDVVLLSPGCTSFDEFRDFEARGEAFRAAVQRLSGEGEESQC